MADEDLKGGNKDTQERVKNNPQEWITKGSSTPKAKVSGLSTVMIILCLLSLIAFIVNCVAGTEMTSAIRRRDLRGKLANGKLGGDVAASANILGILSWFFHPVPVVNIGLSLGYAHTVRQLQQLPNTL